MPAIMDDPYTPTIYRRSGPEPFPEPTSPLPPTIRPITVILRDRITTATILPFRTHDAVPSTLLAYLCDQFAREIEAGDTYPMLEPMPLADWTRYWFQNFAAVMLVGSLSGEEALGDRDWEKECLGSFYVKPNYTGRSSHVCNAGFLVCKAARNKGVGRLLGEAYLDWAPKLGYSYSVFNLVYETNVASCRIWDGLGFKRIGRVKGCGNLKSYPGQLIDAIIYGRELGDEGADSEDTDERFDKIRFYLKTGKYPATADRAEKSRLRSAATHYRIVTEGEGEAAEEKLYLKDKEVISDPQRQFDICKELHEREQHAGINKSTAAVSLRYHWVRIKETVSAVIKHCQQCGELAARSQHRKEQSRKEAEAAQIATGTINGIDIDGVAATSSAAAAAAAAAVAATDFSTPGTALQRSLLSSMPVANMHDSPRAAPVVIEDDAPADAAAVRGRTTADRMGMPENIDPQLAQHEDDLRRRLLEAGYSGRNPMVE